MLASFTAASEAVAVFAKVETYLRIEMTFRAARFERLDRSAVVFARQLL